MKVFVVYYDVESRSDWEMGAGPMRKIDSVYDSSEKALQRVHELERKYHFFADFEVFELE